MNSNYLNYKSKILKQKKKKAKTIRFYSAFSIVLLCCILHISYSALLNLAKLVIYQTKIFKAQDLKAQAIKRNKQLKNEIENFSSMHKIEAIARNNLKMAAKDEVLIIINQPHEDIEGGEDLKSNKLIEFFEGFSSKFNGEVEPDKTID